MNPAPLSELDDRLAALIIRLSTAFAAGERLGADILAQIDAMDDVERRVIGQRGRRSRQVRRAALDLVGLALEPGRRLTGYVEMVARGSNEVPPRPQFIARFSTSDRGAVAIKSYGTPHPLEAAALADCADAGVRGVIQLIDSGETASGSWLELPFLANARSLAEVFTPPPGVPQAHRYPDGRLTRHRRFDQPVDPMDALAPTSRIAEVLADLHEASPHRRDLYPHVGEILRSLIGRAADNLGRSGYLPMTAPAMLDFVERRVLNSATVFSHGDPFPPNVMVESGSDGVRDTLIDLSPSFAPRGFDAARWIVRTGDPTNLRPLVAAYLEGGEDIVPAELAACLAVDAYRFAGDLEAIKIEVGAVAAGTPLQDLETIALLEISNALREGVEKDRIRAVEDLFQQLDAVAERVHTLADPNAEHAGVARIVTRARYGF